MKARITITLKPSVFDPQGRAIENALGALGFQGIESVRHGKHIEIELDEKDTDVAKEKVEKMCKELLANTVIEDYEFELEAQ